MADITRTKTETIATATSSKGKVVVNVSATLTVAESRELRKLLKAEEAKAEGYDPLRWLSSESVRIQNRINGYYFGGQTFPII